MLKLYNTLTRQIEDFQPIKFPNVGIYACGPTVYDYLHIGNMRRYVGDDILVRVLNYDGYKIKYVINITDVGHLTSDADTGQDKMEKGSKKFKMSVWDIAKKFEKTFFKDWEALNLLDPSEVMHATDYINDQIQLIEILEEKGFAYKTSDGIYFNTSKFPNYAELSKQKIEELKAGARVTVVKGKKNSSDFALWKFSYPNGRSFDSNKDDSVSKRQMEWKSPWGIGFPGWHIECSAMSMKALGINFDIHTGGIDHISVHHTNEIAQSEAASGKKFVNYWVHHAFLSVEEEKMSKSLGNFYRVGEIVAKGYDPLSLRYLYLQTHYRKEMNFTFKALDGAQTALNRLRDDIVRLGQPAERSCEEFDVLFFAAVNDDLNMPQALAIIWEMMRSNNSNSKKAASILNYEKILGLKLDKAKEIRGKKLEIPEEIIRMVKERQKLRKEKRFFLADQLRSKIKKMGYELEDSKDGIIINPT
ncbi:MAG: cysteine--tRNA ligase [Candidatus Levybacteria bacterium CG_4_10_14_0_8_um_filter_35_23]|nr:MAG: cysteine--tRNA ligase [Candidatus Levybacteria bacterium CG_4_10_14_0_8_um_filter_35_23]